MSDISIISISSSSDSLSKLSPKNSDQLYGPDQITSQEYPYNGTMQDYVIDLSHSVEKNLIKNNLWQTKILKVIGKNISAGNV